MRPAYAGIGRATVMTITGVGRGVVVTVSRAYGAMGHAVTRALAAELGYRLVDDDLPVVVAARLGTSPEVVDSVEHRTIGFGERFLRSLAGPSPEAFGPSPHTEDIDDVALREIESHVRAAADAGDCIVVGRGGSAILAGRPDLVRVFLTAPLDWRIARITASLAIGEAQARAEIARVDGGRRTFLKDRYDLAWGDPRGYDLIVDVARFGIPGATAILAAAVRAGA
jgi:cytidylate kinase